MRQDSFDKYTEAAERFEKRRRQGGRPPMIPRVPVLELPQGLERDQIERPGPDTKKVTFEAGVVAGALMMKAIPFDRILSVSHPTAGTEIGGWNLNPRQGISQYDLRRSGRPDDTINRVHLEPAILSERGRVYFSYRELHHDIGPNLPPEPVTTLRAPGEGSIENEQIRYGLAHLVFAHELNLQIWSPDQA